MQVTIIGSGNVATVMGRLLVQNGHTIVQVFSRHADHAKDLATVLNAEAVTDLKKINGEADLYLLAVTDDALPAVAGQLLLPGKLVIHTAGSVSKEILNKVTDRYGVLWPMKMIRKSMPTLEPVSIVVDGSSEAVIGEIEKLAYELSPVVTRADDEQRIKMHMLAAFTANFSNHLYHLAADYCAKEQIDFRFFYSIIEETAQAIQNQHPKEVQAGPAFRGDRQTVEKHLQLLASYPDIEKIYRAMTESIGACFGHKLI